MDISEDFSKYCHVKDVSAVTSKSGIETGEFVTQVTLTHQRNSKCPHVQREEDACGGRRMLTLLPVVWCLRVHGKGMPQEECDTTITNVDTNDTITNRDNSSRSRSNRKGPRRRLEEGAEGMNNNKPALSSAA